MSTASNGSGMKNGVDCHCGEEKLVWEPNDRIQKEAYLSSMAEYNAMYRESVDQPEAFWSRIADQFHWKQPATRGDGSFLKFNFDHTKGHV